MKKVFSAIIIFTLLSGGLYAQRPANDSSANGSRSVIQRPSAGLRLYTEVVTAKARTDAGLFNVHQIDDTYLFEIPDALLGRDILVVNRIAKAAAEVRTMFLGYAGDQIGEKVVRFEKGPGHKIFLKSISFRDFSKDSTADGMLRSLRNSNLNPIMASFEIKAYGTDSLSGSGSSVIDVTSFVNSDNEVLYFQPENKKELSIGNQLADRSYISGIKSFPNNIEVRVVKTYAKRLSEILQPFKTVTSNEGPSTYELNSSLVLLPEVPMQPRYFDGRVGYFYAYDLDFDANPQGVEQRRMITRWKLQPKPEDVEKYKRGELVDPQKPIIFYIDPATPKKWVPYLIQGVNDWNVAFECAGFKNAIMAREAPLDDPEWSLEDARHSAIVYKPSETANARGPHVHDPRTGEILESHVDWYHNVMQMLHHWYFVQAAAVDPRARSKKFEDELMGQLIRVVSSHEVGHTLGLTHNWGASSTVPVEKLRNKKWVEEHGYTPSIMDYARFNYVAQPEDSIGQKGLLPRIGVYDKWAIEWGYRWFPEYASPEEERTKLNQSIIAKTKANKQLWYGTQSDRDDPRSQSEDLGDNAMKAGVYGIKNLKRILPNLLEWTKEPNKEYGSRSTIYGALVGQFGQYMKHAAKNIGGITITRRTVEESGLVYEFVPEATQKEAMAFLQQQLFTTPSWLLNKKLYGMEALGNMNTITDIQQFTLNQLFDAKTIDKLLQFELYDASKAYTASEMLHDLKKGIWSELATGATIEMHRRNLQKIYVEKLLSLATPAGPGSGFSLLQSPVFKTRDGLSLIKGQVRSLSTEIGKAIPLVKDKATRLHLRDVLDRLENATKNKD